MSLMEIVHFLEELIRSETKVIAFFVVGVGMTATAVYMFRKWIFPTHDMNKVRADLANRDTEIARKDLKIFDLEQKLELRDTRITELRNRLEASAEQHHREKQAGLERNKELSNICEELKEETLDWTTRAEAAQLQVEQVGKELDLFKRKATTVVRNLKSQVAALTDQIQQIEQQEGRIWETPLRVSIPAFRPLQGNAAVIIAVANLKGGVGKTTLTANMAAAYARGGKRVLVVDLDHQTSLTTLCLTIEQIRDLRPGAGKYVTNLLKATANHGCVAWDNLAQINEHGAFILAANKELADVEEHVKAKWMLNASGPDSRFLLRAGLHAREIQDRFDIILLDCPPRPSTCLVNALTCCDYVLIPARPDRPSTDTVPYFLAWLQKLRAQNLCPNLAILGLVANLTYPRKKPISREQTVWAELGAKCAQEWSEPVHQFAQFIPNSTQFAEAAATRTFGADHPNLKAIFSQLIEELEQRRLHHASAGITAVS